MIDAGAIPVFCYMLMSEQVNEKVLDQVIFAVANIAGDSPEFRDLLLDQGVLSRLLTILTRKVSIPICRNAVWALSNLCRGNNPPPDFSKVRLFFKHHILM